MAGKDVDIIIRAKDRATKEVGKIAESLKDLRDQARDVAQDSGKLSGALGGLAGDVSKLQREADRLKAFGQVAAELDRASAAVTRMEGSVRGTAAELARLARENEQAGNSAQRFRAQIASEENALEANRAALAANRKELREVNKLVRDAEAAQNALNAAQSKRVGGNVASRGVGLEAGTASKSARDSMSVFVAGDLAANRAAQARLNADITNYQRQIKGSTDALRQLRPQASAAAAQQKRLADDTDRAANSLRDQRNELGTARAALGSIRGVAAQASSSLGGIAVSQDEVTLASQRMAAQLAAAKARIEGLANAKAPATAAVDIGGMDPTALATQRRQMLEARKEWVAAQAEVKKLAAEMRATAAPTEALGQAFGRAQAQARIAKDQYEQQRLVLSRLGGTAQSSFAQFAQATGLVRNAANQTAAANNQIAESATRASNTQRILAPQVRQTGAEMQSAASKTNAFNGALLGLGGGTRQALSLMQRLRGEILSVTAGYIGFQAAISNIGGALGAYRDLESIQSRLGAVFQQDTARVAQEVEWLRSESDRLGISLSVLGNQYAKFAVAADASNFSAAATREIFLSVAEAGRVNKLSLDQLQGTFLAIEQIISKGKFTSEEVRRQLGDRLPGAFSILANALGVTTAELDKMMSQGDLLATESNLLKFAQEMTRRFGPQLASSLDTVTTDIGRFENEVFKAQLRVADGFIPALRDAIDSFITFSSSTEGQQFFTQLGVQVGRLISLLAEVPQYFDLITLAVQAFVAVKLAGFIVSAIRNIGALRNSFVGLGQQMAFIGPQMQQVGAAQRVLGQGFAQVVGSIDAYRARLLASTTATSTARFGTLAFASTLGVLRGALVFTATAVRGLWAAFGGLPGIIATGITFAVTGWLTSIDQATTALTEHQRQVQLVRDGYREAQDKAGDWAKTVAGVTLAQAEGNLADLQEAYRSKMEGLERQAIGLRDVFNRLNSPINGPMIRESLGEAFAQDVQKINQALDDLQAGTLSVEEFRVALDDVYRNSQNDSIREAVQALLDYTDAADEGESSLTNLAAAIKTQSSLIKILNGDTSELNEVVPTATEEVGNLNDQFDRAGAVKTYTDAIDTLRSKIPSLAEEMKRLQEQTELNATAWRGFIAALQAGDIKAMGEIITLLTQYNTEMSTEQMLKGLEGSSGSASANLLRRFEAFSPTAYWDVNAYRAGYGSDTVTLDDGSIQKIVQGMTVTQADAERDLARRIAEFQDVIRGQIGADRFESFGTAQQAALTSVAYNYGSLPDRILEAVRGGNAEAIAAAIRSLGGDNNGINRDRRNQEAQIFAAGGDADLGALVTTEEERLRLTQEQNAATEERLAQNQFEIEQQRLINEGRKMEAEIEAAIAEARKENPNITEAEVEQIRQQTAELYNLKNARDQLNAAEEYVNQLMTIRQQLLEQIKLAEESGDQAAVVDLRARVEDVNTQLDGAVQKAIAMWQAIGGTEADAAIAKLQTTAMSVKNVGSQVGFLGLSMQQWGDLAGSFADGLVGVFDSFAQAIANGENAVEALGRAFLQFAADFLRQIATMILKQMILNALQSVFPGLFPAGHTGGVVGTAAIGGGNRLGSGGRPSWMGNALKYHSGGIAGLKPNEVNATLKVGEEVLTEEDPRHRNNLGGEQSAAGRERSIKQVLVLDPKDLADAMSSRVGEEVIVTHIKNNAATIRQIIR